MRLCCTVLTLPAAICTVCRAARLPSYQADAASSATSWDRPECSQHKLAKFKWCWTYRSLGAPGHACSSLKWMESRSYKPAQLTTSVSRCTLHIFVFSNHCTRAKFTLPYLRDVFVFPWHPIPHACFGHSMCEILTVIVRLMSPSYQQVSALFSSRFIVS